MPHFALIDTARDSRLLPMIQQEAQWRCMFGGEVAPEMMRQLSADGGEAGLLQYLEDTRTALDVELNDTKQIRRDLVALD